MFKLVRNTPFSIKNEIFAGISVAIVAIVQSVLFCSIANLDYKYGILSFVIANVIAFFYNGRRALISGSSNLLMLILFPVIARYGFEYVVWIVIVSGLLQFGFGFFRLGKYIRMMPKSVVFGVTSGVSILIILDFSSTFFLQNYHGVLEWVSTSQLYFFLGFLILAVVYFIFVPKYFKFLPASLVLLILAVILLFFFPTILSVSEYSNTLKILPFRLVDFTRFPWVPIRLETLEIIFLPSILIALSGIIQSLFLLSFTDRIMNNRGKTNKELLSQGIINIVSGLLGGVPVASSFTMSTINLNAGGKGKIAGLVGALILISVFFVPHITNYIPFYLTLAIMLIMVVEMVIRSSFYQFKKLNFSEAFILVSVATIVVLIGVLYAVIIGAFLASAFFFLGKL